MTLKWVSPPDPHRSSINPNKYKSRLRNPPLNSNILLPGQRPCPLRESHGQGIHSPSLSLLQYILTESETPRDSQSPPIPRLPPPLNRPPPTRNLIIHSLWPRSRRLCRGTNHPKCPRREGAYKDYAGSRLFRGQHGFLERYFRMLPPIFPLLCCAWVRLTVALVAGVPDRTASNCSQRRRTRTSGLL